MQEKHEYNACTISNEYVSNQCIRSLFPSSPDRLVHPIIILRNLFYVILLQNRFIIYIRI